MKFLIPIWSMTYSSSRRKHNHRCRVCNRIIAAGDAVIMARLGRKKTWCIHEHCAEKKHACGTWRDALKIWAFDYQLSVTGLNRTNRRDDAVISKLENENNICEVLTND